MRRLTLRWLLPALCVIGLACSDEKEDPCAGIDAERVDASRVHRVGGALVRRKCVEVASWNSSEDGLSYGEIVAPLGAVTDRCEIDWIDHDLDLEPVTDRPGTVSLEDECLSLGWEVADRSVADIEAPNRTEDPWGFVVRGKALGQTTARFTVRFPGQSPEIRTGLITIVVEDVAAPPAQDLDLAIVLNGIRTVFIIDDAVAPSCGATVADPGYIVAKVGEITDGHYSVRIMDTNCGTQSLVATNHMAYEFKDPCIAGIVDHPEHFGVTTSFHMEGIAAGETEMRIRLFDGESIIYRTPWIRVVVTE